MSYQPTYKKGDWKALCDRCGFLYKASELKLEWTKLRVCKTCWEPRHPQDFLRGKKDDPSVPWTRSEGLISVSSSDSLLTWAAKTSGLTTHIRSVDYFDGLWVAVGDSGKIITSDDDGESWTTRSSGGSADLRTVKYWEGNWYIVGYQAEVLSKPTVLISADGLSWSTKSISGLPNGDLVAIEVKPSPNPIMVFVGWYESPSQGMVIDTANGSTWNIQSPANLEWGYGIGYDATNDSWILTGGALPYPSPYLATSPDGSAWTERISPFNDGQGEIWDADHNGSVWVIAQVDDSSGDDKGIIWVSTEFVPTLASHWTQQNIPEFQEQWIWRISHDTDGNIIACGGIPDVDANTGIIAISSDNGSTWVISKAGDGNMYFRATYGPNYWMAVGDDGIVLKSSIETTTTVSQTTGDEELNDVCQTLTSVAGIAFAGCAIAGRVDRLITVPVGTFNMSL